MKVKTRLTSSFKDEISKRIIPHIQHLNHDIPTLATFRMNVVMKNYEGQPRNREIHTRQIELRLNSGADRNIVQRNRI